jgi:formamidopyrimidine-DNA glycosylase
MPELAEVETIVRTLRPELVGRTILSADVLWERTLAIPSPKKFRELVRGQRVQAVSRRAKFLVLVLENYNLLVHLRMSGDLRLREGTIKPEKHDRLILTLSTQSPANKKSHLAFNDTRKFGRVWLTDKPESVLGRLGPEPLGSSFTANWLYNNLKARKRQLKPLLLDQTFLAGLGNIYTDESLNMAKLHPLMPASSIRPAQAHALHKAIRAVLREGIRRNGASIDWVYRGGDYQNHFRVYDQEGKPCRACGAKIIKLTVGQRGTHICPRCQKLR